MIQARIKNLIKTRPIALILLIFLAFIALGMPDGLLGVGWPSIRAGFGQPLDVIGMLLFTMMVGYLTSSFLSGELTRRWGVGNVLIISCIVTSAGLIGYTLVPRWWMMVALGLLAGLGAGAVDSSLNAYVAANFGPGNRSAHHDRHARALQQLAARLPSGRRISIGVGAQLCAELAPLELEKT